MAAEKKPDVILEASENDVLITSVPGEDDLVGVDVVFGCGGDALRFCQTHYESAKNYYAKRAQRSHRGDLAGEQKSAPQGYENVDHSEQHRRANQSEIGHQQDGEQKGCAESAEIVEGEHVRYNIPKVVAAAHQPHQKRNLKAHEDSNNDHQRVHQKLETLRVGEGQEQQGRGTAANHSKQQLDPHETVGESTIDVARERAA